MKTDFIKGMGKRDDEFIIILDIDKILSYDELSVVQQTGSDAAKEEADTDTSDNPTDS